MNLRLSLPQEKVEVFALFFGAVLIASVISRSAFYLIQNKLPTPSMPLPIWLAAVFCFSAFLLATQVQNNLLRVAIVTWGTSKVVAGSLSSNHELAAWLTRDGFFLLAGVLMVGVGVRKCRVVFCVGALLLLVGLSVSQYYATLNWVRVLENIGRR